MAGYLIKNFEQLATSTERRSILTLVEAGLEAIQTEKVIQKNISVVGNMLFIQDKSFNLTKYNKIKIVGFGKASAEAALALEKILENRIKNGVVIGLEEKNTSLIQILAGTHPVPSEKNFEASQKIYELLENSDKKDLILVLISGGGSALLNYPQTESVQGAKLYETFLKKGASIQEMNTVRKHLSLLKGGGLAKLAYPATVIGLIFSDVPGNDFASVASGPTYKDDSTMAEAQKIIQHYSLGEYELTETPKEDKYFDNVYNFVLVSNEIAVKAIQKRAVDFRLESKILGTELYDQMDVVLEKFLNEKEAEVILAAGEPKIEVLKNGQGGRNSHLALKMLIEPSLANKTFISLASDGIDNGPGAGAIVDAETLAKAKKLGLNPKEYLENFDSFSFFEKVGDNLITGPTGANVSDLMILLNKKDNG